MQAKIIDRKWVVEWFDERQCYHMPSLTLADNGNLLAVWNGGFLQWNGDPMGRDAKDWVSVLEPGAKEWSNPDAVGCDIRYCCHDPVFTLDILGGYNKVTVKDSNYPVGNLLPEENYEDAKALSSRLNTNKDRKCYRQFLYPKNWNMYLYDGDTVITNDDLELRAYDAHKLIGGIQERYCNYKIVDGKPDISDYSFTNVIQARCLGAVGDLSMIGGLELLTKIMDFKGASSVYESGAFAVSGSPMRKRSPASDQIAWNYTKLRRRSPKAPILSAT